MLNQERYNLLYLAIDLMDFTGKQEVKEALRLYG